ncbi:hypothetical protein [Priestia aryabhattai]|uniref:hypothetical protein n=1 Tax=Priestia aryabhattai TaxID=412384 RepID=UPI001C8E5DC4|nr:hypothetical protein [Priestia aryabhattai]MBY0062357.1 hypothetical protein [Priestia aryabhattai]
MNLGEAVSLIDYGIVKAKAFFQTTDYILSKGAKVLKQASNHTEERDQKNYPLPPLSHGAILKILDEFLEIIEELSTVTIILSVKRAYKEGNKEDLEYFMEEFLKLKRSSNIDLKGDRIEALWIAIQRAPNWARGKEVNVKILSYYLKKSVVYDSKKIRSERKKADNLSERSEVLLQDYFNIFVSSDQLLANPLHLLIAKESNQSMLEFLMNNLKTKKEKEIVQFLFDGHHPKDCVKLLNCQYHQVQSIRQKLKRRIRKHKVAY